MVTTMARILTGLAVVAAAAGCATPQLDALRRDLQVDPAERVRLYNSCRARAHTPPDLDHCMDGEGFRFVSAGNQDYRTADCWTDRDSGAFPKAYCYEPKPAE